MSLFFATQYGWGAVMFFLGIPVTNWSCAGVTAYAALRKRRSWSWLIPAHLPIFISVPLSLEALRGGREQLDQFTTWSFLVPAGLAVIAVILFVSRRPKDA